MMKTRSFVVLILLFIYQICFAHIRLVYPIGGETFNFGQQILIEWDPYVDHGPATYTLEFSTDGGASWTTIKTDITKEKRTFDWTIPDIQTNIAKIKVIQANLEYDHIAEVSGNITFTPLTSVKDESLNPIKFKLNNAYPNPFNNTTIISYQLNTQTLVQLVIYDINGRKIKNFINQVQSVGKHEVKWDATGVSSGTYYMILKAGNNIASQKVILLK